jgi:hypothetical protein
MKEKNESREYEKRGLQEEYLKNKTPIADIFSSGDPFKQAFTEKSKYR